MEETEQDRIERLAEHWDTHQAITGEGEWLTEPAPAGPMVVFSLRLPRPIAAQLRAEAAARGLKPTELAREWITQHLNDPGGHNPASDAIAGQLEALAARLRAS